MKYIPRIAEDPALRLFRKNKRRRRYITGEMQKQREGFLHQYEKPSYLTKSAESYYISGRESKLLYEKARKTTQKDSYLFPRAGTQALTGRKAEGDLDGLERLSCQPSIACSNNCKEVETKKSYKMGFELMELKTDGSHYEFLIRETIMNRIVEWEDLPDVDTVREYLKKNGFPEDKLYSKEKFLDEVKSIGYVHLWVEKRETAGFILDLCYKLIHKATSRNSLENEI